MRSLKKGLALVCMLAMVLQLIFAAPVVSAAEPNSYDVVFLSDLHNGVGGYNGLKQMMTELKNEGQNPRVLSHGGDYVEDDMGGQPDWQTQVYDVISGTEKAAFPEAKQVYTLGNHDFESGTFGGRTDKEAAFEEIFGFPRCGLAYADDEMEIYMIGAQGVTGAGGGGEAFIQADIDAFDQYLATKVGSKKVIFLQTHWPAHSSYNFKQRVVTNADKLIDVMNKYGDDMDLVWIWGHNHYEDAMRYVILQPGEQIMYAADTSGSSWGDPKNPQYKTIKFTYANCGCMNDMWWHHDGHNDTNASGNYRGPSACLSVAVDQNTVTYTYNRIKQDGDNWVFSHDANIQIYNHNILMEHPATVVVDRVTADHTHEYEVAEVVEPTCTEKGYTVEKCKLCDRERTVDPTDALGHAWDEGVETVPATVEKAGVMTYTCTRCGETKTARIPRLPGGSLTDIDFTDPADEGKFDVENKDSAAIVEGTGLTLTPTADAFEPIGGGFGGGEATPSTPKDLIKVPVSGDWTATTKVSFDQNAVQFAFNSYFAFLAMEGEDYQNMAGIRGTNNVFQDFLRKDGTIAAPTVAAPGWQDTPTSGFTANGDYWLRLDKDGTSYTGAWSADGESFTELFTLEDTDVDAEYIVLDAYKTSTFSFGGDANWLFTLKTLEFEGGGSGETPPPAVNKAALNRAIADAEAVDTGKYTDETVAALNAALADARAAKDSEDQAVVDAAAAALNAAIEALELKPVTPPPPVGESDFIDFTNPADAEKFAVVNKDTAEIAEGEGLTLEWTADAFEPVSAGWNQPAVESAPKDLIRVPVSGDWTATLQLELDRGTVNFAFLAMQGEDYQNMVGIRATNAAAQDFLRTDGNITAAAMDALDTFGVNGPYWFRIEKEGTTYTCTLSTDGAEYSDLFVFEDTGIEADYIVIDAYKTSSMSFGGSASYQFQLKRLDVEKPAFGEAYVLAGGIEAGKQYVIVADGAYAMTNEEVPGKASYANAATTRGAKAVEIADGRITSEVDDSMLWTFEASTSAAAYDGEAQYWLVDAGGRYLRRGSMSQRNAALILDEARTATARYYTWSFKPYDDGSGYAMYVNSERAYGSDYPGRVAGDSAGFDIPGTLEHRDPESPFAFMNDAGISHITLYEKVTLAPAAKPAVASISVDGAAIAGFEPKLRAYAVAVPVGGSAPSVTAEPGNSDTVIEVAQAEGVPGEAVVTATSPRGVKTYVVGFDYPPKDEYFADGALNEGQWTILNEVKDPTEAEPFKYYRLEKGMGLVMPTQHNSIYQKATPGAWSNMFTMSGGGDWEVVAKAFYPAVPQGNYQQVQFIAWQDEDNYVRINCQDSRQRIEPFYEKNGTAVNQNGNALNDAIAAAEDGTMTMYFKINKTGSTYTISYSEDAKEWKSGGVYEAALTNVKVAVFCTQDYQPTQSNYMEPVELAFEYVSVNGLDGQTVRTDDEMLVWAAQNAADYIAAGLPDEASDLFAISAAPHGYGVTLSSSDPDVISEAGFVTPAAADKNVDVTVTVRQGDVSASATKTIHVPGTGAATGRNIDFTNPADAEKFTVDNQTVSEIKEGEGFYMISTNEAIEDCKGQLSGDAANTPRDTVQVPVEGDWTATLYVKVDTSGSNGQYEFLCLYGMADYDNGVGIRAGNGSTVNFKEVNGVNESSIDGMKVQTGLTSGADHWYRLEKVGTTYTGYLSADGETFDKVFTYEDTGIEANMIVIDAYSGRSVGYQYWLQSLTFEGGETPEEPIDPSIPIWENTQYSFAERAADLIARMSLAQKGSQLITTPAAAIPASSLGGGALNVPSTKDVPSYYWWCEALHGYNRLDSSSKGVYARNHEYEGIGQWGPDNAVSYPMSLTVGNTWNPDLYYAEALEVGDEIRELTSRNPSTGNAIDLNFYSPTVNLQRDPRWGRNEESYSEDPYLTARMASQYVLGMEGKDQSGKLLDPDGYYNAHSTIKHFVANNSEANRTNGGAVSSLNALRNYYMAPYRSIIKATNISSVMTAYSTFNGEPCSYSSYLMDTLLRQVYGFEGYFTSDCDSVGTMVQHTRFVNPRTGKTLTNVERLATALAHGEDLECIGGYAGVGNYGSYAATMVDAKIRTDKGLFTENTFDVSLMRLLTARIATGEFDEDLQLTKDAAARTQAQIAALGEGADISAIPYNQTPERLAILDQVNNEGVVMLQNKDNFLPLSIPASGEYKVVIVGAWQTNMYLGLYSAKSTNSYNHINIQKGITDAILAKNPDATFTYITSDTVNDSNREAIQAADVCVVVGGANGSYSQEGRDRTSLAMANNQAAMFSQVGKWNPNTVAVMEYQGPLETYTFRDDVKAMLWSSFGGIHKGVGFGNIIVGNVNPSGKLTATWFRSAAELPPTLDYTLYSTDDQVGRTYMYYEGDGVDYPFGYGLSFTSYEYSDLKIDKTSYDANDTIKVSFNVKNTGSVAGKETAQLYIAQPGADTRVRPIRRLEGFQKVELQPGETKTVSLEVKIPDLAYYNEADDCYAVDTGAYQVQVGKDSASLGLAADFTVTGAMDVYPQTLTVKANAVGDSEKGIEERLIYDVGAEINPQLTVAMNNEKLYGYIIADQQSLIKSMSSTPLPEGMTFTYESNRPGVVKVAGGKLTAAGPGVATVTVTGTLGGHVVTADFIVYVESKPQAISITLDGEPLEGFEKDKYLYEVEVARGSATPVVAAVAASDSLTLTVKQPASVPGIAEVIVTDPASGASETYQIGIGYKPVSTDFSEGLAAAKAKGWSFFYEDAEKYAFGEDGLTLTPKPGEFGFDVENPVANVFVESALGDWVAETTLTPAGAIGKTGATHRDEAGLIVYGDNGTSYRVVYNNRWNASNGVITYQNSRINVYLVVAGNDNNFSIANASVPAGTEKIHLRMIRTGNQCQAQWSSNGTTWNNIGNAEPLDTVLPQVGVFSRGNDFTAAFDGLNILKVSDVRPQLAELCLDGQTVEGFEPGVYTYNLKLKEPADHIPAVTATAADEDLKVEITQFDAPTGVAKVVVSSAYATATYSVALNYGPAYDYLADGEDGTVKGKGFVPTADAKLTMPAMGTWAVVAKAFVPKAADFDGQSIGISVVQDARNSVNINLQGANLQVQPSRTNNGTNSTWGYTAINLTPAEDGSATVYFMIDKDPTSYTMYASADGETFQRLGNVAVTYVNPTIELRGVQTGEDPAAIEYVAVPAEDGFDAAVTDYFAWAAQCAADYIAADLPAETAEDLALSPAPHGYSVTLASSDPAVISAGGKVTPAAADKDVTVTVTVSDGSAAGSAARTIHVPGAGGAFSITAPHVVKVSQTKANAGDRIIVTADDTIADITVQTAGGKDVPVEKLRGYSFAFTMPADDVTVKTYYAADAVAALQGVRQKGNPFIPIYDFNPDTEPHVWEDPDNPGQYRFYFLSSHDMDKVHYCSTNHVLYSCPVDDPFNWTYHGVIVGPENTEHDDILYAPDMGCVEDPTSPTGKYYYYYPCNQAGGRQTMVLRSSRPDGKGDPFTVVNWEDETHNRTTGSIMTFDPSIFVDDDGKVYGYWGGYNSTCHGAQLDPATNFTTAVEGTQLDDMLGDGLRGETFGFYEASSMRKIDGVYVFVYSRQGKDTEPEGANYNQLGYAYSDSPLGPWTFGGIVVDAQGEVLGWPESRERTFAGGNTHGSLVKLGDQWYVTYHRNVETYARQAMIEPIDVVVNADGSVKITQAEMTSKGFYVNGLNPYAKVSIGTTCFMTGNGKIQPLYEHDVESLPVINLRANSVVGLKYFDFNTEAPKGSSSSLKIDLVPKGVNATLNVWLRPQSDLGVAPFSENCIKIGEYRLTSDLPKEKITVEIPTPAVDTVDGQWGVFYSFSDVESNGNIVELYDMQFEFADHEHDYTETVVAPTCLEGGYTLGTCKVCGKEIRYNYTKALGHAWDEGTVTVAPTTTKTGLMTYTCTRCGETMTRKLPRVGVVLPADIDFTDPADKVKYEIVNQDTADVIEGEGVTLTPTADAFEPIGGGFGGGAATESEPKDLIKIPVSGNWIATTRVDFNQNDVQFAFNSYFSFLAMEGEDYQNMAGIRGTNNVFQDYLRTDGAVAAPTVAAPGWGASATSGFTANGSYWLRLEKAGTSYTAAWSADGESFTELFTLEDTGVDAEYLLLDAYKTSTFSFGGNASWLFTLKYLNFEDNENAPIGQTVDYAALEAAIAAAGAVDPSLYTDESVAAMQAALADAQAALSAGDQAAVDAAAAALNAAVAALELKPIENPDLEELYRLAREALARAEAARQTAEEALAAAEAAAGADIEALEAARAAAQAAQAAAEQAAIQAAAAQAAAAASDRSAAEQAALAADSAAYAAEQAANTARAQAAAQAAQAAAEAAQAAAEAAQAAAAADQTAAGAARQAAEEARAAADAAKQAAQAADADAAAQAAQAAAQAAISARAQAEAAAAQAAAEVAQAKAEAARAAAEAAQANAEADQAAAAAAKQAAESAKAAAENAKAAAEAAKNAADGSNTAAAASAAQAAQAAADVAAALSEVAAAQAEIAEIKAQAGQTAAQAAAARAAAEAAQRAAEAAQLNAGRYQAMAQLIALTLPVDVPEDRQAAFDAALEAGFDAIKAAPDKAAIDKALADAIQALTDVLAFRFDDVQDPGEYYFDPVYWAVDEGITTGTSENLFSPDAGCTRAQVVTFLWRAAGEPEPAGTAIPFEDVKADAYFAKAVQWAVEQGITTGTSATTFRPYYVCTRAQIVTFLWRAAGKPAAGIDGPDFADVRTDAYYYDAVRWAVEQGITKGTGAGRFSPDDTCTRAQVVTFLCRAAQKEAN